MLEKLFKETFLKELNEIEPADFIEPNDELGPGEHLVGEMNDLEKTIFTLLSRKTELKKLILGKLTSNNLDPDE